MVKIDGGCIFVNVASVRCHNSEQTEQVALIVVICLFAGRENVMVPQLMSRAAGDNRYTPYRLLFPAPYAKTNGLVS